MDFSDKRSTEQLATCISGTDPKTLSSYDALIRDPLCSWIESTFGVITGNGTGRLIEDLPSGRVPGLERPALLQLYEKLSPPRYEAILKHWGKALSFLDKDNLDLPNAVKEAVSAMEALALVVCKRGGGTLGDCIKDFRKSGMLKSPLDKVLEGIWGYSSDQPGVRHGKAESSSLNEIEATFVINLTASVIFYLLEWERPYRDCADVSLTGSIVA